MVPQGIVAERLVRIRRVQIDHVLPPRRRDSCRNARHEIAVRVDKGQAVAAFQVLERHVLKERRFTRAGFPDDVEV